MCPLNNKCLTENTIYLATVSSKESPNVKKYYIGASKSKWKFRYYNHINTFTHVQHANKTALSKFIWNLKNKLQTPIIKWSLLSHARPPNNFYSKCGICLEEKLQMLIFRNRNDLLNHRNEFISKCRHKEQFKLKP